MSSQQSRGRTQTTLSLTLLGIAVLVSEGLLFRLYFSHPEVVSTQGPSTPEAQSTSDPGTIVFAGLSGSAPMYFDSGPNKGFGYVEYYTHEIRKGVKEEGLKLKQEYMTPARIAYEFRRRVPICTYPAEWSDQKNFFSKRPDRIYSIPLEFGGEEREYIVALKAKLPLFQKHLDEKGDLLRDSLLQDTSLSTLLIQDKDYGALSQTLLEEANDQTEFLVKPKFRRHIHLKVLHENRQLIEMLNSGNIDYVFSRSFDLSVLSQASLNAENFIRLPFSSTAFTQIDDPRIKFHSISCSIHPLTIQAMPYFNRWIKRLRESRFKERKVLYQNKLLPAFAKNESFSKNWFADRFREEIASGKLDQFYSAQQRHFPELKLFPPSLPPPHLPPLTTKRKEVCWFVFRKKNEIAILNAASIYHRIYAQAVAHHKNSMGYNAYTFDHRFVTPLLPAWLIETLKRSPLPYKESYRSLSEIHLPDEVDSVVLNGSGLAFHEIAHLLPQSLKSLLIWDGSQELMGHLVKKLPDKIEKLNLLDSILTGTGFESRVSELKNLRELHVSSTNLRASEVNTLIQAIPEDLVALSLGSMTPSFESSFYKSFGQRKFKKLEYFDFSSNGPTADELDAMQLQELQALKYLNLRGITLVSPRTLEAVNSLPHLEDLNVYGNFIPRPLQLKATQVQSLVAPNIQLVRVRAPLKALDLLYSDSQGIAQTPRRELVHHYIGHLDKELRQLAISFVPFPSFLDRLLQQGIRAIDLLDLSLTELDDSAAKRLATANWKIKTLQLDYNKLSNQGVIDLLPVIKKLEGINLTSNSIAGVGAQTLAEALPPTMLRLELSYLLGLDVKALAQHLPQSLKMLNLAGNSISDQDMVALAPTLPSGLLDLNLSGSAFGEIGAHALAEHMPPWLNSLNILGTPVGDRGIAWILQTLPVSLYDLTLKELRVSDETAQLFAKNMPPFLRKLRFEQISGSPQAIQRILKSLPRTLEYLSLSGTAIGTEGGNILAGLQLPHLRQLDLFGTQIGKSNLSELGSNYFKTLNRFELSDPTITDEGLSRLLDHPLDHLFFLNIKNPIEAGALKTIARRHPRIAWVHLTPKDDLALKELIKLNFSAICTLGLQNQAYDPKLVLELLRNLKGPLANLLLTSINFPFEMVDELISVLPQSLQVLSLSGNPIGQKGQEKLEAAAERRRLRDGIGFSTVK